ncbi:MAG: hypothetical protein OEV59_06160 [Deltaproteobacteria bacterium]|nr:hypothetical protein [Deltaproteobacteria bacterium]
MAQPGSPGAPNNPLRRTTDSARVIFYTDMFKIVGDVHHPVGGRVSDFLNKTISGQAREVFISVTNAECFSITTGQLVHKSKFMSIHKDHIHMAIPAEA